MDGRSPHQRNPARAQLAAPRAHQLAGRAVDSHTGPHAARACVGDTPAERRPAATRGHARERPGDRVRPRAPRDARGRDRGRRHGPRHSRARHEPGPHGRQAQPVAPQVEDRPHSRAAPRRGRPAAPPAGEQSPSPRVRDATNPAAARLLHPMGLGSCPAVSQTGAITDKGGCARVCPRRATTGPATTDSASSPTTRPRPIRYRPIPRYHRVHHASGSCHAPRHRSLR